MKLKLTPEQVLSYFHVRVGDRVRKGSAEHQYYAQCPLHPDRTPSFSFNTEKQVFTCFLGCGSGSIVKLEQLISKCDEREAVQNIAQIVGVPQQFLNFGSECIATYDYTDQFGRVLYQRLRYEPKRFTLRKPDGKGGWIYKLDDGVRRVPYRLSDILTANEIIYVEGEKDADRLRDLHLERLGSGDVKLAVTTSGSASDWREEFAQYFKDKKVVILPHQDENGTGQKHGALVAQSISRFTDSIKIVNVPAKDVSDYLDAGHSGQDLLKLINETPQWKSPADGKQDTIGILLSDVMPENVEWLWQDWIPQGKLTILEGDAGLGKSTITVNLAARITTGRPMPDGKESCTGGAIILTVEDGLADTVRPRLDAAGGNAELILCMGMIKEGDVERPFSIPDDIPKLEEAIRRMDAKLVIFDPLVAFLNAGVDSYKDQQVRRALAPLAALAERTGVALVVIRHLSKAEDKRPINRGAGSIAFAAAARSVIAVGRDPDFPENKNKFVLASVKSNLAAPPQSQEYAIEQAENGISRVVWMGPSEHTAESLLTVHRRSGTSKLEEAEEFLRDALASGTQKSQNVIREAKHSGIAEKTLRRAMKKLGIKPYPEGLRGDWMLKLPDDELEYPESQLASD